MKGKGIFLLILCIGSLLCAAPFIWIYCGAKANGDLYEQKLINKTKINLDEL